MAVNADENQIKRLREEKKTKGLFMSLKLKSLYSLAALSAMSISAQAEGYFGVKAGPMVTDISGFDTPINAGILFGTNDTGSGFEGELTKTVSDGEYLFPTLGDDISLTTLAFYATYRSDGNVYLKGKFGVLFEDIESGNTGGEDSGASYGIGLGFRLSGGNMLEIEYTSVEEDVLFVSAGVNF